GPRHLRGGGGGDQGDRREGRARDHDPAHRHQEGARHPQGDDRPHRGRGDERIQRHGALSGRHHDRAPARRAACRRDRRDGGVLQLRHQRPDADLLRPVARRRRQLPRRVPEAGHPGAGPVHFDRSRGRRRADEDRCRARSQDAEEPEARHLRRAWRRSRLSALLPGNWPRLRVLLALSRADRPPRRGAGGAVAAAGRDHGVTQLSLASLVAGGKSALASALARLESTPEDADTLALLDAAYAAPRAHVVGVTGPPGVGKSTLIGALIAQWRASCRTVGVIAVDPSSRSSGGALLGDRTRLRTDPDDAGVFVRSMAARDKLGGLAALTVSAMVLMRALYDIVLIETVGVGQSETDVAGAADTVVLCVQPGSGDSLQFMKAGIVEIPHVVVVTKSDLGEAAERARGDALAVLGLAGRAGEGWQVPVLALSALRREGVSALAEAIDRHWASLEGRLAALRAAQARHWLVEGVRESWGREGLKRLGEPDLAPAESPFRALARLGRSLRRG